MITCKTVTDMHTAAGEGALGWWQRLRYRFHMGICPPCKAYQRGLAQTVAALPSLKERPPEDARAQALERLRERRRST